jgi:hypothetical protein
MLGCNIYPEKLYMEQEKLKRNMVKLVKLVKL